MRDIQVDNMAECLLEEIQVQRDQSTQSETPQEPAWIDMVQIGSEKQPAARMRELPIPPKTSTPEPAMVTMPFPCFMQTPIPTFTGELERILTPQRFKSPFKTLRSSMVRRFHLDLSAP